MADQLIEFHTALPETLLKPVAAKALLPEWFKQIGTETDDPEISTVKRCAPFFESLACGYYMLLEANVELRREDDGRLVIRADQPIVGHHSPLQTRETPIEGVPVIKFTNHWIVKTPPGYSTLFIHPINRFHMPVTALSGLVETDTYYREVNFPALVHLQPGQSATLARGTPIVQMIPIRREAWGSKVGAWDFAKRSEQEAVFNADPHRYRDGFWEPKKYG